MLYGEDPVSDAFFDAFWGTGEAKSFTTERARKGLEQFRAYAMLRFGGFRFAFKRLGTVGNREEIVRELGPWAIEPKEHARWFRVRPHGKTLRDTEIPKDERWYLGYLSSQLVEADREMANALVKAAGGKADGMTKNERRKFEALSREEQDVWTEPEQLASALQEISEHEEKLRTTRNRGLTNTAAYLAANHIDVYVATSMREQAEFVAVAEFVQRVFDQEGLDPRHDHDGPGALRPTYFDPTDSYTADRIDKGLLEGLMLRLARCTIYMVQESDTFGKDSELAASLALGKVAIAYVPLKPETAALKNADALRRRALVLLAENRFDANDVEAVLKGIGLLSRTTVFKLVGSDAQFEDNEQATVDDLRGRTIEAEQRALDRRATMFQLQHPLALQLIHGSGVANGVLLVRSAEACAHLVRGALLYDFEFVIEESKTTTDGHATATLLTERSSGCAFRVVTNNDMLTNTFWSRYVENAHFSA